MIKILIADGHAVVRCGLKQIIAATADIAVVGEAAQGFELIDKLRICDVDLVLLEMTLDDMSGIDLIRRVCAEQPRLPVLVLSTYKQAHVVSRALRAGATGFVTKSSDPDVLLAAIRRLAGGGKFIDPKLVDAIIFETCVGDVPPHEILSDREFQVLEILAVGNRCRVVDLTAISIHFRPDSGEER